MLTNQFINCPVCTWWVTAFASLWGFSKSMFTPEFSVFQIASNENVIFRMLEARIWRVRRITFTEEAFRSLWGLRLRHPLGIGGVGSQSHGDSTRCGLFTMDRVSQYDIGKFMRWPCPKSHLKINVQNIYWHRWTFNNMNFFQIITTFNFIYFILSKTEIAPHINKTIYLIM